jgi:hypothetical protein
MKQAKSGGRSPKQLRPEGAGRRIAQDNAVKDIDRRHFAPKGQSHDSPGQSGAATAAQRRPGLREQQEHQP